MTAHRKIDLARVRADTPGCAGAIHLNNAGAALMPKPVADTLAEVHALESAVGGYEAAAMLAERCEGVRDSLARLVGAGRDHIALTASATHGWHLGFHALAATLAPGDRLITGPGEYVSNYLTFLQARARYGIETDVAPALASGEIDLDAICKLIGPRTRLIAVTHAPANDGLINPAEAIGRIARDHGLWYLLDACQSVGQIMIDVEEIGCDFLSATSRKFLRGPRGAGFLYASERACGLEPPFIDLHGAELADPATYRLAESARRYETFERSIAVQLALGVAADYALEIGIEAIEARNRRLAGHLRAGLGCLPGTAVRDHGSRLSAIVTVRVARMSAGQAKQALTQRGIYVHLAGDNSATPEVRGGDEAMLLRISPHYYNEFEEIDTAIEAIASLEKLS